VCSSDLAGMANGTKDIDVGKAAKMAKGLMGGENNRIGSIIKDFADKIFFNSNIHQEKLESISSITNKLKKLEALNLIHKN
jgi:hypothetical protein